MKERQAAEIAMVHRMPGAAPLALERSVKEIDRAGFDVAVGHASQASAERELLYAAHAPTRKAIEHDVDALKALRKLGDLRKERLKGHAPGVMSQTGGPFPISSFNLNPGLHVFAPPFDLDRPGPTTGSPATARANRDTGEVSVNLSYDSDASGWRAAAASLVMIFQPSTTGTLSIRPYTKYAYSWLVAGLHLSAHTEGHLVITATRSDNGQLLDSRTVTLWSMTTESDVHSEESDGVAWPPDYQVNFLAEPGHSYLVAITAVVSGDQSGVKGILMFPSWSMFCGSISASVPWLVAELRK